MLAEDLLKQLGAEGRAFLLRLRPDLADPPPASLRELALRAVQPGSLSLALRAFDTPTMQVTEVLAALGESADRRRLEQLLGIAPGREGDAGRAAVARAADTLRLYLFAQPGEEFRLLPEIVRAWPRPLGLDVRLDEVLPDLTADRLRSALRALGVPTTTTRKADLVTALTGALIDRPLIGRALAAADRATRERVVEAAFGRPLQPLFTSFRPGNTPTSWALERCLAFGSWEGTIMPAEVALTLRGDGWHVEFEAAEPATLWAERATETVRREVGAAAGNVVRIVTGLLEACRKRPVPRIKSGAIGVRELRRLAKELGAEVTDVRLALALAGVLELVAPGPDGVVPSPSADSWLRRSPAEQAGSLVAGWLALPDLPTLGPDEPWLPRESVRLADARAATLAVLLAHSGSACDAQMLTALLHWRFPMIFGGRVSAVRRLIRADGAPVPLLPFDELDEDDEGADDHADGTALAAAALAEATWLGVVADGALTPVGVAALSSDKAALEAELEAGLGAATTTARLQADLTAVVLGHPAAELTMTLDALAVRETRSVASTWRFTPVTIRQALDAGWSADDVLEQLTLIADGDVPQPLTYLIGDVARRHGHLRGGDAGCYLRGDDAALLREVAADRRLAPLGLHIIGEGVLIGARPLDETLAALRRAGYAPVADRPDGRTASA